MKWTPGTDNDDVIDQRGDRGGGGGFGAARLTGGGLAAVVVVVLVARVFGVDISGLLGGGGGGGGPTTSAPRSDAPHPPAGADPDKPLVDFVKFVMKDIQGTFEGAFRAEGQPYRHAKLVLFTDAVSTGCGRSSSAIGPFYCPADEHAYIDLSFYRELRQRFGAPGNFAQAYVLAHEIGHHVQKLIGIEHKAQQLGRGHGRNDISVRTELQADCFAGVWGHAARGKGLLEADDLERALTAATAIGDDRLQKQSGREVNPETFTHGTSAQRVRWFRAGFDTGKLGACDTFSARDARDL
ncbi:MAG TPA: neutral zinc metallopeptidase [Kofleriaceae bacterium]|nr:neutral zinc metallopeptidase [Kofleriaceae bacterium]